MRQTDAAGLVLADLRQLAYERRAGQVECPGGNHAESEWPCPSCGACA